MFGRGCESPHLHFFMENKLNAEIEKINRFYLYNGSIYGNGN